MDGGETSSACLLDMKSAMRLLQGGKRTRFLELVCVPGWQIFFAVISKGDSTKHRRGELRGEEAICTLGRNKTAYYSTWMIHFLSLDDED